MTRFTLGTRGSALALAQAELTRKALAAAFPELEVTPKIFVTRGDQKLDLSFIRASEAGGKGLFTKELEEALLSGEIDVAVHSLKDLPGHNPPGLAITAVLERASVHDVLITKSVATFAELPGGAIIGTSSVRRARQLQWLRPDLRIEEWRGNVPTRLRKLGESERVSGIVLAAAGLERLGHDLRSGVLESEGHRLRVISLQTQLLPALGQGVIALQSRADRADVNAILATIDHAATHLAVRAEREVQRLLAGDCSVPVGVRTTLTGGRIHLRGILFRAAREPALAEAEGEASAPEAVAAALFARLVPTALETSPAGQFPLIPKA